MPGCENEAGDMGGGQIEGHHKDFGFHSDEMKSCKD